MLRGIGKHLALLAAAVIALPWVQCHCDCHDGVEIEFGAPPLPSPAAGDDEASQCCPAHADLCGCSEHDSHRDPSLLSGGKRTGQPDGAVAAANLATVIARPRARRLPTIQPRGSPPARRLEQLASVRLLI